MKKLYCVICVKYRKFEKPKIYLLEKTLRDKAFNVAKNPKCDGYHCWLASIIYVLIKKTT